MRLAFFQAKAQKKCVAELISSEARDLKDFSVFDLEVDER
jgi:hypothetical protein